MNAKPLEDSHQAEWISEISAKATEFDRKLQALISKNPMITMAAAIGVGLLGSMWLTGPSSKNQSEELTAPPLKESY